MEHLHFYPGNEKSISFRPRIVFSGTLSCDVDWSNVAHRHSFCEIMYVTSGSADVTIDYVSYKIKAGDIVVYNAGVRHEEQSSSPDLSIMFFAADNIRLPGMQECCVVPDGACPVIETEGCGEAVKTFLPVIVNELNQKDAYYKAISTHIATALCYYILRFYDIKVMDPEQPDICEKAKQYIDSHYDSCVTLDTLAKFVHLSKYHFSHIFKVQTGMTPMQYLQFVRLNEAKELLSMTDMSIGEIAVAVGYDNALTFSRVFRNNEAASPTGYRKDAKQGVAREK